jgi:acyl-CoA thioesterase
MTSQLECSEQEVSPPATGALARLVAETLLSREGTGAAWDLRLEDARPGYAVVAMMVRPDMTNGHGTIHGGMIFALADSAFAYACNSRNVASVAQSASVIFLAPARAGEDLVAEAREVAVMGRSGCYEVSVRTRCGRSIAHFQGHSRSLGTPVIENPGAADD